MVSGFVFKILSGLFPLNWGPRYTEIGKYPSRVELLLSLAAIRFRKAIQSAIRGELSAISDSPSISEVRLRRRYTAFTVTEPAFEDSNLNDRPSIRLLWMTHRKDFRILHHSIDGLLRHLKNPVRDIVFISPDALETKNYVETRAKIEVPTIFFSDSDFMTERQLSVLRHSLGQHAGWAASQLIKVNFILSSESVPTLMVDSDTVLLRDKQWLYNDGRQLLYFRWYENPRYESYLRHWGFTEMDPLRSFITHHTLFQPELLRNLMDEMFSAHDLETLVTAVADGQRALGFPEFCIDDEPYGQVMFKNFRDRVVLDKYSNINRSIPAEDKQLARILEELRNEGKFNSVSFHNPER